MKPTLSALTGARVQGLIRLVLLALCTGVAASQGEPRGSLPWVVPLGLLGYLVSRPDHPRVWVVSTVTAEALLASAAVLATGSGKSPFLPYLIAPAFSGGLAAGFVGGLGPVGVSAAVILLAPLVSDAPDPQQLSSTLAQWVVLAALVAVVAGWVRGTLLAADRAPDLRAAQAEAFRLLTEFRNVARRLPGTLDPATSAEAMLERARDTVRYDAAAVLVGVPGSQQLTVVAQVGTERPHWDVSLSSDTPLAEVWLTQRPHQADHQLPRTEGGAHRGSSLVVPLLSGARTFGLVVLESGVAQAFPPGVADTIGPAVDELALQLQTALVFDEIRELATTEERRRLAREIHDGIAQELASIAYGLDGVAAEANGHPVAEHIDRMRVEVRRLVTELRMSLFDLRSDIDPDEGLGAAIGRHVRAVGTAAGVTVHLSLNESPVRLAAETEAELLRIVQEAVANARKHAHASNLWVTCTVDPPGAAITVEDDGVGVGRDTPATSHGLAIMSERAARIRAELTVERRAPRGTKVTVSLGRVRA